MAHVECYTFWFARGRNRSYITIIRFHPTKPYGMKRVCVVSILMQTTINHFAAHPPETGMRVAVSVPASSTLRPLQAPAPPEGNK